MTTRILQGDCREVLKSLPDASVHMVCTSPPYYGLRNYQTATWEGGEPDCDHRQETAHQKQGATSARSGRSNIDDQRNENFYRDVCGKCGAHRIDSQIGLEQSPAEYVAQMVEVFREVRRVLRPDAVLFLNLGDSFNAYNGDAGPSSSEFEGRRDLARPKLSTGHGLQVKSLKPKDLMEIPSEVARALRDDGWYLRARMPWIKRSCMPESAKDRPTSAIEYVFMLTKRQRYFWDPEAVAVTGAIPAGTRAAKGSNVRSELKDVNGRPPEYWEYTGKRNFRNSDLFFQSLEAPFGLILDAAGQPIALDVNPQPFPGAHFAVYPPALIAPLIKAGTSERGCCAACGAPWVRQTEKRDTGRVQKMADGWDTGTGGHGTIHRAGREKGAPGVPVTTEVTVGWAPSCSCNAGEPIPCTILDPFGGAGTSAVVADRLGRDSIMIELNVEYCEIARRRLEKDGGMFAQVAAQ